MKINRKRITKDYIYIGLSNSTIISLFRNSRYLGISLPNQPHIVVENKPKYYNLLKDEKDPKKLMKLITEFSK